MRYRSLLSLLVVGTAFAGASPQPFGVGTTSTGALSAQMTAIPITARILKPITLTGVSGLDFGAMYQTSTASASDLTFTPSTAGANTVTTTNATTFASAGVTPALSEIDATGTVNKAMTITVTAAPITLSGAAGSTGTVTVTQLLVATSTGTAATAGPSIVSSFGGSGVSGLVKIYTGGTLHATAGADGDFTGSFDMTVAYN